MAAPLRRRWGLSWRPLRGGSVQRPLPMRAEGRGLARVAADITLNSRPLSKLKRGDGRGRKLSVALGVGGAGVSYSHPKIVGTPPYSPPPPSTPAPPERSPGPAPPVGRGQHRSWP